MLTAYAIAPPSCKQIGPSLYQAERDQERKNSHTRGKAKVMHSQKGEEKALGAHHGPDKAVDKHKQSKLLPIGNQPKLWGRPDVS
jgi:hypothetical protein